MIKQKLTQEYLDKFFEDTFLEDDNLLECLLDREGSIEESYKKEFDNEDKDEMVLIIKLVFKSE